MPHVSRWTIPVPDCSLPTFLFTSASHQEPAELANKPAYIDAASPNDCYYTRAGLKLWAQRFGLGLTKLSGFTTGDRIQIFSPNSMGIPVVFYGILMAGGIFTAANPAFTARELATQLNNSGASYMLTAESSLDVAIAAAKDAGLPLDRVRYFDADYIFHGTEKKEIKGVRYFNDIFADSSEAKNYQWPELKGT